MHQLLQIEITILTISLGFQHLNTPKKINQIYKIITWLLQVCMEFMRNTFCILGIIHSKIVYIQRKCSAKYKIFKQIAFYRILTHLLGLAQFLQLTRTQWQRWWQWQCAILYVHFIRFVHGKCSSHVNVQIKLNDFVLLLSKNSPIHANTCLKHSFDCIIWHANEQQLYERIRFS